MPAPTRVFRNSSSRKRRAGKSGSLEKMVTEYQQVRFYGSLGGASPVKRIDPKTGEVVEVLDPDNRAVLPKAKGSV